MNWGVLNNNLTSDILKHPLDYFDGRVPDI